MKKKTGILILLLLCAFLFTSCDEVLSVVTENKNGEKVVNNYISMYKNSVYDKSVTIDSWENLVMFKGKNAIDKNKLLFTIKDKKENILVAGDAKSAVEVKFIDEGYTYTIFSSMDSMNKAFSSSKH